MDANIGLNTIARVKLTPFGKKVLQDHYADTNAKMRKIHPFAPAIELTKRELSGEFELWRVMAIFGPHLYTGGEDPFVDGIAVEILGS